MPAKSQAPKPRGAVLIFALLLLMIMMTIGFVLASLIYKEIAVARSFPDSLQAYYAAESGIEDSLDLLALRRQQGGLLEEVDDVNQPETLDDAIDRLKATTENNVPRVLTHSAANYLVSADETKGSVANMVFSVPYRRGTQVDMYDPDQILSGVGARSVELFWTPVACANHDSSLDQKIEVTYQVLNVGTDVSVDDIQKEVYDCTISSTDPNYTCMHTANWLSTTKNHILRFTPLDCSIPLFKTVFYDGPSASGQVVNIPSVASVTAIGRGKISARKISVLTKWVAQASGLTDFVIFSIDKIEKLSP
ncbi:MAG: hypothetical protein A2233_02110 [Candidatus Kerfeldbacteria bacterium RIFOXYA2_FULL_38_24]|uniref:Type 4 fimbrial biogenesis protein PilX N-terminal domain-containing protein n=1 Tax=Candidatus Kerfeldbacteria bacterium RIFOXYB2_FULL_38_14 TaxID=1798547 RepID=A0A1G2BGQ7_9BACT|nr:MAG: hypothetical protein A2319_04710 [Candidatus Kerfeldbacteria bacterium RIFOXYB2_FULL_38_14]OGY87909.1 MAG: hypothetical protein A2233_02110 [Candidatus Kerfeldbacteria bacterium RIFOXYA2_FULL_38_24]OGY88676.1 MAG: hypothetical protein A2458_03495 [Candidatus Kerfeldbacteria bacterium RIFOXYC2_FULL_38_9]